MTKIVLWNREFELEVIYETYDGIGVSDKQTNALKVFQSNKESLIRSKDAVEAYFVETGYISGAEKDVNLFRFIMPRYVYVTRDGRVSLMCDFKYDLEHGIAIVFKDGELEKTGPQDIIL